MIRQTILALALFSAAPQVRAVDTNAFFDAWFAAQKNVHTWTADFTQTRRLKTLTQPLRAEGRLWFAAPEDFRWELGRPAQTTALRRGGDMYLIYPLLKRAEHYQLGEAAPREWRDAMSLLDAGFPSDRQQFTAQFKLLSLAETNGIYLLDLEPRSKFARQWMPELRLGLATNDYSLAETELIFVDGSSMRSEFTNTVLNPPVDPGLFAWKPPPDFKITEPLSK